MRYRVKALLEKRRWLRWAASTLATSKPLSDAEANCLLDRHRKERPLRGPARSYENLHVSRVDAINAILKAFSVSGTKAVLVIVGDADEPAVFQISVTELEKLLTEAPLQGSCVSLVSSEGRGSLLVDLPEQATERGEVFVVGAEDFESLIDTVKAMIPGGVEFRGNYCSGG